MTDLIYSDVWMPILFCTTVLLVLLWFLPVVIKKIALRGVDARFKVKEREQELELALADKRDKYNRDKFYWDKMNEYISPRPRGRR